MLELIDIIWVAAVLFCGSLCQGAVGFGVGLLCIPLLVLGGISLPAAIAIMLITMFFANSSSCYFYREHLHWGTIIPLLIFHLIALPLGVVTLYYTENFNPDITKAIVGIVVLGSVAAQLLFKTKPVEKLPSYWTPTAGLISGYIEGLVGMGSPPLIIYVVSHKWDIHRIRTTVWFIFLVDIFPLLLLLWFSFGHEIVSAVFIGVIFFPLTFLGTRVGNILGHALGVERLRIVAYAILVILGISTIVLPFLN